MKLDNKEMVSSISVQYASGLNALDMIQQVLEIARNLGVKFHIVMSRSILSINSPILAVLSVGGRGATSRQPRLLTRKRRL